MIEHIKSKSKLKPEEKIQSAFSQVNGLDPVKDKEEIERLARFHTIKFDNYQNLFESLAPKIVEIFNQKYDSNYQKFYKDLFSVEHAKNVCFHIYKSFAD